jgi:hypothetical protein
MHRIGVKQGRRNEGFSFKNQPRIIRDRVAYLQAIFENEIKLEYREVYLDESYIFANHNFMKDSWIDSKAPAPNSKKIAKKGSWGLFFIYGQWKCSA